MNLHISKSKNAESFFQFITKSQMKTIQKKSKGKE